MTTENLVAQDLQPLGAIDVSDPTLYQEDRWAHFARLRREAPVHYCAVSRYGPFWSVTRYNDIMAVELDPCDLFLRARRHSSRRPAGRHEAAQLHPA